MSTRSLPSRSVRRVLVELSVVGGALSVVYLWRRGLRASAQSHATLLGSASVAGGFGMGFICLTGCIVFLAAYASRRDVLSGFSLPFRIDLFALELTVFALVASTYQRSESLLPLVIAYLGITLTNYAIVLGFETHLLF